MSRKIKTVEDIAGWQLCCGCGACAYVDPEHIEMIDAFEYGRRPRFRSGVLQVNSTDSLQVCPGIELNRPVPGPEDISELYSVWGPVLGLWEGHASDLEIRYWAASGGIATALGVFALEKLGYHGVLHITARQDVPYLNRTVLSTTRQQLLDVAGSRYAPASPCDGLAMIESAPGPCVFIGKPCDVAALQKTMKLRPKLAEKVGLTIAFFCAGTPALKGTFEMFKSMGITDPSQVRSVRYRGRGWPGNASVSFVDSAGQTQVREMTYNESWGEILQKFRQWRCYICPDHTGEFADIAVADAWHRPVADCQPGRSVIVARTDKGKSVLQAAIEQGDIITEHVPSVILPACRPGQAAYQGRLWARLTTLRISGIPILNCQGYDLFRLWRLELSAKDKITSFCSTIKRVFTKQLYFRKQRL